MGALAGLAEEAWGLLAEGAADPASPWRIMTLANISVQGGPGVRSVVLRAALREERVAEVHTDRRSPKMAGLAADPRAAMLGWDPVRRVQIRLDGVIKVACARRTEAAWAALPPGSRATYAGTLAPGMVVSAPGMAVGVPDRQVFAVLRLHVAALEYLSLAPGAHVRARFDWAGGTWAARWLAP